MKKDRIKKSIILITIIISIVLTIILINTLTGNKIIGNIYGYITGKALEEQESKVTCIVYDNQNANKLKALVQIENNVGIEYVEEPNKIKINGNGKTKIFLDYETSINTEFTFYIKAQGKSVERKDITITQEDINNQVQVSINETTIDIEDSNINVDMQVFYNMKNVADRTYYYNGTEYVEYTDSIRITTASGNISLRKVDQAGNILDIVKNYNLGKLSFVTFGSEEWSNEKATTTISKVETELVEGEEVEYSVIGKNNISWRKLENTEEINNLYHKDTIFARIVKNGEVQGTSISKTILDTTTPKEAVVNYTKIKSGGISGETTDIDSNLTTIEILAGDIIVARVNQIDEESGIDIAKSKWIYNNSRAALGTNPNLYTGEFNENGQEIECKLIGKDGARYLHILSCDKAGKYYETIIQDRAIIVTGGDPIDVFELDGVASFDEANVRIDSAGLPTTSKYKENYKVGADMGARWYNATGYWSVTIDAQRLFNNLGINKISKFNMEIYYSGNCDREHPDDAKINYSRIYVKYERRHK